MNKLKEINSLGDLKEFVYLHKEQLRKAALPVTVAAAVLVRLAAHVSNR